MTTPTETEPRNDSSAHVTPQADGAADDTEGRQAAEKPPESQDRPPANREARYRTERNEARAQVAELTARVTKMQRTEVERQAAGLHDPGDLWTAEVDLAELLNGDGDVDPERVAEAVAALADSRPYLMRPSRGSNFGQGNRTPVDMGSGTTWGSVLRGE